MNFSLPAPRSPTRWPRRFSTRRQRWLSATVAHFALASALAAHRAGWLQSRHARPFLRRPQRPGARNAFTFGEPQQFVPRHCSRRPVWLAVREPFGPFTKLSDPPWQALRKTAAEPALRDHWQRDVHACSESTVADLETFHNRKLLRRCAKPVDENSSLWKMAENRG